MREVMDPIMKDKVRYLATEFALIQMYGTEEGQHMFFTRFHDGIVISGLDNLILPVLIKLHKVRDIYEDTGAFPSSLDDVRNAGRKLITVLGETVGERRVFYRLGDSEIFTYANKNGRKLLKDCTHHITVRPVLMGS